MTDAPGIPMPSGFRILSKPEQDEQERQRRAEIARQRPLMDDVARCRAAAAALAQKAWIA